MGKASYGSVDLTDLSADLDDRIALDFADKIPEEELDNFRSAIWDCLITVFPRGFINDPKEVAAAKGEFEQDGKDCLPKGKVKKMAAHYIGERINDKELMADLVNYVRETVMQLLYFEKLVEIKNTLSKRLSKMVPGANWNMSNLNATEKTSLRDYLRENVKLRDPEAWFEKEILPSISKEWREAYKNPDWKPEEKEETVIKPSAKKPKYVFTGGIINISKVQQNYDGYIVVNPRVDNIPNPGHSKKVGHKDLDLHVEELKKKNIRNAQKGRFALGRAEYERVNDEDDVEAEVEAELSKRAAKRLAKAVAGLAGE